jgi:hypothetical protein
MTGWVVCRIVGAVVALAMAAGCGGDPEKKAASGEPGCLTATAVISALATRPGVSLPPGASIAAGPVCERGWAFAAVAAPDLEDIAAVLRYTAKRWDVLTYGSDPCANGQVRAAPAKVRSAAGC